MKKTVLSIISAALCAALLLTGCQTEVETKIERPAVLDVKNSTTIAVMPFKGSAEMAKLLDDGTYNVNMYRNIDGLTSNPLKVDDEQRIMTAITEALINDFEKTGRFTVVPSRNVMQAEAAGKKAPADLVITGGLTYFGSALQSEQRQTTDKKGGNVRRTPYYWRDITLAVVYSVLETKTNTLLENREAKYTLSSEPTPERSFVPEAADMAISKVKELSKSIVKDFLPYTEDIALTLLFHKDTTMKTASTNAQLGKIDLAIEQFQRIYDNKGYFEAGYNIAVLYQALGNPEEAYERMSEVYGRFKNDKAKRALIILEQEIASKNKLQTQKTSL